jgi:CheY-like chemotaxis protein
MSAKGVVLLVEDDPDIREIIHLALDDEGYDVEEATDGRQALAYLRSHAAPRVILLDWNMTPMNGARFLAEVSKDAALSRVPVVVITADARAPDVVKAKGHAGCLPKPFRLDALFEIVRRYSRSGSESECGRSGHS